MSENVSRRSFLKKTIAASAGTALGLSLEERALLAATAAKPKTPAADTGAKRLPIGKIGNVKISSLICGGNLINGYAHSRDLIYVSSLLKHYFTDEKIFETLRIAEENGINTLIANVKGSGGDENTISVLNKYWKMGGKIQWLAQADSTEDNPDENAKKAIDNGAVGVFIQGACGDTLVKDGRLDVIEKVISLIKDKGLIAGVGGHTIDVPIAVETADIGPDFYFKTLNTVDYYSASPRQTIEFMKKVNRPWIAYKVLGAGAVHPKQGFKYAFDNGADFVVAGMFDFQIEEDIIIAKDILSSLNTND
jgi:hypothetical protein